MISAGVQVAVTFESEENNIGAVEWKKNGIVSLDMAQGEQEINIGGAAWESGYTEKLEAPSLDGKYVMDPLAFPLDLMLNGLPQYLENLETAVPEFMQLVKEMVVLGLEEADLEVLIPFVTAS